MGQAWLVHVWSGFTQKIPNIKKVLSTE